ncbi:hypothetical protein P7L86_22775 [Vibrio parahaemolyticus]|nr:hypothetical protein [Vibrio parahaemolyticus]
MNKFLLGLLVLVATTASANDFIEAMKKQPSIENATTMNGWASNGNQVLTHLRLKELQRVSYNSGFTTVAHERLNGSVLNLGSYVARAHTSKLCATGPIKDAINNHGYVVTLKVVVHESDEIISTSKIQQCP